MAECWDQMTAGMKVEVACGEEGVAKDAYWVATVIAISGRTKTAAGGSWKGVSLVVLTRLFTLQIITIITTIEVHERA